MIKPKLFWTIGAALETLFLIAVIVTYIKGGYGWLEDTLFLFILSTNLLSAIIAATFLAILTKKISTGTVPSFTLQWLTYLFLIVFAIVTIFHTIAAINYAFNPLSQTLF